MKHRRFWRQHGATAAIVAAAAGLGVYVFAERNQLTTHEREQRQRNLFPVFRPSEVTAITVTRGDQTYRLHRTPGTTTRDADPPSTTWSLEQGEMTEPADAAAADKLVSALGFATPERRLAPADAAASTTGLSPPRLTVTVAMGNLHARLVVGGPAVRPAGAVYVEVDGTVAVVRKDTLASFDLPVDAFRERKLLPFAIDELASIRLERSATDPILLERGPGPGTPWRLAGTLANLRADRRAVERALAALAELRADSFLATEQADTALTNTAPLTVTLTSRTPATPPLVLRLGETCPEHPEDILVRLSEPRSRAACAGRNIWESLALDATAWPDRHVTFAREPDEEQP